MRLIRIILLVALAFVQSSLLQAREDDGSKSIGLITAADDGCSRDDLSDSYFLSSSGYSLIGRVESRSGGSRTVSARKVLSGTVPGAIDSKALHCFVRVLSECPDGPGIFSHQIYALKKLRL